MKIAPYSEQELDYIINNYRLHSVKVFTKMFNKQFTIVRTLAALMKKAIQLGANKKGVLATNSHPPIIISEVGYTRHIKVWE
jgi:hypothetical protein